MKLRFAQCFSRSAPIHASGALVGTAEVSASLRPLLAEAGLIGLVTLTALLGNLANARGARGPAVTLLGIGLMLGAIAPSLIGLLFQQVSPACWGIAFGGCLAAGWLGTHALEPLMDRYSRRSTTRQALWLLIVGLLLLALVILVLALIGSQ